MKALNRAILNQEKEESGYQEMKSLSVLNFLFGLTILLILSSCGGTSSGTSGGNTTSTITGQIIDDPIQGIDYNCSSGSSGVTNTNGEYTCNVGDDVTFSIGPVTIGTLAAQSNFITPYTLFANDTLAAINFARLVQSMDSDGNASNGIITLSATQMSLLPSNTSFSDPDFVSDIETALGITLISSEDAQSQLNDAIILFGGTIPDGGHIPVANAGMDDSVIVGNPVILDGTGSYDSDGDTLRYEWSLASIPNGSVSALFTGQDTYAPNLTPDVEGPYVVQLRVNDGVVNSAYDTVTITATADSGSTNTPLDLDWIKEIVVETSGQEDGGIAFDSENNFYVAGDSIINFNGDINSGYQDILVIKYNAAGDMQWSDLTGTSASDLVEDIAFDDSENALYVAGHTTLSLHDQAVIGDRDIFLIKYDADGNRVWTIMDGTALEDRTYDISIDSNGNIYLAGMTYGNFDGDTNSPTGRDIFVAKYNSSGSKVWTRQEQGNNWERAEGITIDSNDNIYITGYTASPELNGETSNGSNDSFIIKYNSAGALQWTRLIGTIDSEYGYGITTDSSDNVYVAGQTTGDMGGRVNQGGFDQFVAKYSTNGAHLWTASRGGPNHEAFTDAVADSSGQVYISGYIQKTEVDDIGDYTLSLFDPAGDETWTIQNSSTYGTHRSDFANYLALDSAENVYVNGTTYGSFISEQDADSNKIIIAKYGDNISSGGPYSVGGTVSGTIAAFTLTNNGGDDLSILDNGSFTFSTLLPDGAPYNVEILEPSDTGQGELCEVVSGGSNGDGTGIIDAADVTDIVVSCAGGV